MCLLPNLALSLPLISLGNKTPTQGLGHRGVGMGPSPENVPTAGSWERGGESLLIYLWPWHSLWGGAPPRGGTDGVPGSQQCLSSRCHRQERLYLSSPQEAMKGEGFGEAGTLLGNGNWAPFA